MWSIVRFSEIVFFGFIAMIGVLGAENTFPFLFLLREIGLFKC